MMITTTTRKTGQPLLPLKIRKNSFLEAALGFTAEKAMAEAARCQNCHEKTCVSRCPLSVDTPAFAAEVAAGRFEKAYDIISRRNPIPSVTSRICSAGPQCQCACAGPDGEPVAVAALERFVADYHEHHAGAATALKEKNGHKVAVIGSGPSGLSCSGELARRGYDVTVVEPEPSAGGVLRYAVPSFTLPESVLCQSLEALRGRGVDIRTGAPETSAEALLSEGYEAVYVAAHGCAPHHLNVPGEALGGIVSGEDFLARVGGMKTYRDAPVKQGDTVLVIGGGNMALDAARCARRMGGRVMVLYRGTRADMTAGDEAVQCAIEEDITFRFLTEPVEFVGEDDCVASAVCRELRADVLSETGLTRLMPLYDTEFEMKADCVIAAAGRGRGDVEECDTRCADTSEAGAYALLGKKTNQSCFVFSGSAPLLESARAGRDAAGAIDEYIRKGKRHDESHHVDADAAAPAAVSGLPQKSPSR